MTVCACTDTDEKQAERDYIQDNLRELDDE